VYAVYVTHAFVVTAVGYALSVVPVPTLAKVAIAVVVALPACFALAGLVRWLPGMRRVLGPDWPERARSRDGPDKTRPPGVTS
jgi:hypothetical protein